MLISENWTKSSSELKIKDLYEWLGNSKGTLLYGRGLKSKFWIAGKKPLKKYNYIPNNFEFERNGVKAPFYPDHLGFVSYEYAQKQDPHLPEAKGHYFSDFPDIEFNIYSEVLIYDLISNELFECKRESELLEIDDSDAYGNDGKFEAKFHEGTDDAKQFKNKVERLRQEIFKGNVYQANITRQEKWKFKGDLQKFARKLFKENPAPFSAYHVSENYAIISSSPERFIKSSNGLLQTHPIKGTAPRGKNPDEDKKLISWLLNNVKERAELAMITDLLRNDLSRISKAGSVIVGEFARLETYSNVHHLVSDIYSQLKSDIDLDTIINSVFPGGSISGCPKSSSLKLINELEEMSRRIYTGSIGWVSNDGLSFDWNIAIRTCLAMQDEIVFGVGGGITWESDPQKEYEETIHKAESIVKVLSGK